MLKQTFNYLRVVACKYDAAKWAEMNAIGKIAEAAIEAQEGLPI